VVFEMVLCFTDNNGPVRELVCLNVCYIRRCRAALALYCDARRCFSKTVSFWSRHPCPCRWTCCSGDLLTVRRVTIWAGNSVPHGKRQVRRVGSIVQLCGVYTACMERTPSLSTCIIIIHHSSFTISSQ